MADKRRRKTVNKKNKKIKKYYRFSPTNKKRLMIIFAIIIISFIVLLGRLIQINVKDGQNYEKTVLSILSCDTQTIPYERGDITDRNKTVLATNEKIYSLILDAYVVTHSNNKSTAANVVQVLEKYFGEDPEEIQSKIKEDPDNRYIVLKKELTYDDKKDYDAFLETKDEEEKKIVDSIENTIWFEESYRRIYPYSSLAADVIGFTSSDYKGLWGLEKYYEQQLTGINGKKYGYLTEDVNLQKVTQQPINGNTIVSTIDVNIQRIAEKAIEQFMKKTGAENVAAIVMNPNNGEILAMASAPTFDLNDPRNLNKMGYTDDQIQKMTDAEQSETLYKIWKNFCVNNSFEPGSTVKTLTVSYAMDQGLVKDGDPFDCDGGETASDGTWVSCNATHGLLTLKEAIMYSCNDALMQIGTKIGVKKFLKMQELFGLGQKTGIDLPGEEDCYNLMYHEDSMGPVELWTSSFGQGYNVTMVQVAAAFSSIVNGGKYYQPHIVSEILSDNGNVVQVMDKLQMRTTVSEATSKWMLDALYQTVENGTGHYARVPGYKIGGKTGTAEKGIRGSKERLVSFIGVAPIDDPQVVVYVIVDEAHAEDQGQSSFASKIVGRIFKEVLPYLQIFPTEPYDPDEKAEFEEDDEEEIIDDTSADSVTEEGTIADDSSNDGEDLTTDNSEDGSITDGTADDNSISDEVSGDDEVNAQDENSEDNEASGNEADNSNDADNSDGE